MLERTRDEKRRSEYEEELTLPPFPQPMMYLWRAYYRLRRRKGGSGFGPAPIEWPDIDAFSRYSGLRLTPWEVETLEALDDLFLASLAEKADG